MRAWLLRVSFIALCSALPGVAQALQAIPSGYTATLIVSNLPAFSYPTMALAPNGNLYLPKGGGSGILQVTPSGSVSQWSASSVSMLAFEPDGSGYASGVPS